jgi:hypothetical protein
MESEFSFLVLEEGCSKEITGDFSAAFVKGGLRLTVEGIHYGLAIDTEFTLHGEYFPGWRLVPEEIRSKKGSSGGTPQLDMIRDCAAWAREGLRGLFRGEPATMEKVEALLAERRRQKASVERNRQQGLKAKFFEEAGRLFKEGKYGECVRHLEAGSVPLPDSWRARLDYARRHA